MNGLAGRKCVGIIQPPDKNVLQSSTDERRHRSARKHEERSDALRRAFSGDVVKGGVLVATRGPSAAEEVLGVTKYHRGHRFLGAS